MRGDRWTRAEECEEQLVSPLDFSDNKHQVGTEMRDFIYYNHNAKVNITELHGRSYQRLGLLSLSFCHQNAGEFLQVLPHLKYV